VFPFSGFALMPGAACRMLRDIDMTTVHVRIEGRVQGVGFRWFVTSAARALGVSGRVRNLPEGSVEIDAHGPRSALERLLGTVRRGPPGARISAVHEQWGEGDGLERGFEIDG
jgi:acylphosphatase